MTLLPGVGSLGLINLSTYLYAGQCGAANTPQIVALTVSGLFQSLRPRLERLMQDKYGPVGTDAICFLTPFALIGLGGCFARLNWRVNLFVTGFFGLLHYQIGNLAKNVTGMRLASRWIGKFNETFLQPAEIAEVGESIRGVQGWKGRPNVEFREFFPTPTDQKQVQAAMNEKLREYFKKVLEAAKASEEPLRIQELLLHANLICTEMTEPIGQQLLELATVAFDKGCEDKFNDYLRTVSGLILESGMISLTRGFLELEAKRARAGYGELSNRIDLEKMVEMVTGPKAKKLAELGLVSVAIAREWEDIPKYYLPFHQAEIKIKEPLFLEFVKTYAQISELWRILERRVSAYEDWPFKNQLEAWCALMREVPRDIFLDLESETLGKFRWRIAELESDEKAAELAKLIIKLLVESNELDAAAKYAFGFEKEDKRLDLVECLIKDVADPAAFYEIYKRRLQQFCQADVTIHAADKVGHLVKAFIDRGLEEPILDMAKWDFLPKNHYHFVLAFSSYTDWLTIQNRSDEISRFEREWTREII